MPFTLDIIPHVPSLDMHGTAKAGSAYSLSGEVVLTLTSPAPVPSLGLLSSSSGASSSSATPTSTFRPTTIYLSSLLVTFEGKAELLNSNCPYAPFRLCQVEKELVGPANGGRPIILTNRAQPNGVMRWSMTFDLAIPGWLPPSVTVDEHSGASYSIHAQAKFADDLETAISAMSHPSSTTPSTASTSSSSSAPSRPGTPTPSVAGLMSSYFTSIPTLPTLFNPFTLARSKLRSTSATAVPIKVNRFRAPKSLNPFRGTPDFSAPLVAPQIYHPTRSLFPVSLESVETRVNLPAEGKETEEERAKRIPVDVLSNIEVVAGVPEYVGTSEDKVPLSLRVRLAPGSDIEDGIILEAFDVEVEQMEKFRSAACDRYAASWPVPPPSQQPPLKPLLTTNHLASLYSLTTLGGPADPVQWTRAVPLIPSRKVNFRPAPATGGLEIDNDWAKMDLAISVLRTSSSSSDDADEPDLKEEEKASRRLRRGLLNQDFDTPFCKIRHEMKLALKLSWLPAEALASIKAKYAHIPPGPHAGEKMRKARMAHPDRLSETLLISLPIRLVQVSERVETIYRTMGFHHGAADNIASSVAMRRTMAQSRSASPALSAGSMGSISGRASPTTSGSGGLAIPGSAPMSRSCSASPALSNSSLPALSSSSSSGSSSSGSCSAAPSVVGGPVPYGAAVAASFPGGFVLPPYSELYYSNGDRKDSLGGGWLPKYTEKDDLPVEDTLMAPMAADAESDEESEHGSDVGLPAVTA